MNARANLIVSRVCWIAMAIIAIGLIFGPALCFAQVLGRPASESYVTSKINAHASTNNAHADIRASVFAVTTNVAALKVAATNATEAAHAATVQANEAILKNTQQDVDISYLYASNANALAIANLANTRAQAANVTNAQNGAAIASVSNLTVAAQNTANAAVGGVTAVSNLVIGVKALNENAITNETDRIALQALATNRVTAVFNPTNANEFTDGARRVWRVSTVTNTFTGWSVIIETPISICGEIIQPSTNQWPGVPYPLWTNSALSFTQFITNYPAGSTQPMLVWYYYRTGSASPHEVHFSSPADESTASWYSNYGSSSAGNSPRGLLGQDDVSSTWSSWIRMIYGTNTTVSVITSRVDTVAWQSDVTGKVDRVNGTASDLTVNGTLTLGGVSKSAWPAGSSYPTNYIAGFALPIPGTNMIYTLNVSSNGILEIWGVTP